MEAKSNRLSSIHIHQQVHGSSRRRWVFVPMLLGMVCLNLYNTFSWLFQQQTKETKDLNMHSPMVNHENELSSSSSYSSSSSSCTEYHSFPWTSNTSGLPYLSDVFASRDGHWVYIVGHNRGACYEEFKDTDRFGHETEQPFRFVCIYPDNTHVISEYIHPPTKPFKDTYIIRCQIPAHYQSSVNRPQKTTNLHIDLHRIDEYQYKAPFEPGPRGRPIRDFPSMDIKQTPKLERLPICHPLDRPWGKHQFNLTAMTRLKSGYGRSHHVSYQNASFTSPVGQLIPWMEYHIDQGFDHFVIYDNDEEPHGPIEKMMRPFVERGLVTYRWWPMKDCFKSYGKQYSRVLKPISQLASSVGALNRFGDTTRFFAHMDVDEMFVIDQTQMTVWEWIQSKEGARMGNSGNSSSSSTSDINVYSFLTTRMAPCNGTIVSESQSVLEKWQCLSNKTSNKKMIMRGGSMMLFHVHWAAMKTDRTMFKEHTLNGTTEGYLAHFRGEDVPSGKGKYAWWHESYSGKVVNEYSKRVTFLDDFLSQHGHASS